jgi:hypothetical protein
MGQAPTGACPLLFPGFRAAGVTSQLLVASISMRESASLIAGRLMLRVNLARVCEQFLDLPVAVVLLVLWVVGAVLEGAFVAALYWNGLVVVKLLEAYF